MGLVWGFVEVCFKTGGISAYDWLTYGGRVIATCAVFYVFFLCRVLGAGDIKLMAVCVGSLGVETGAFVILCGLLMALIVESLRRNVLNCGYCRLQGVKVRLAPYLLAGYCLRGLYVLACC